MSIMNRKTTFLAAAVVAVSASTVSFSGAEARWRGHHHHHRGAGIVAGLAAGALIGGALLAPRAYAHPYHYGGPVYYRGPVYVDEPIECHVERRRVWSERRGRYIIVNREVCD